MEDAATVSDYAVQYKSGSFIASSVIKLALQTGEVAAAVYATNPIIKSY